MYMFIDLSEEKNNYSFKFFILKFSSFESNFNELYEFRSLPESRNSFMACDNIAFCKSGTIRSTFKLQSRDETSLRWCPLHLYCSY